jgi:stage II sporulation protein D
VPALGQTGPAGPEVSGDRIVLTPIDGATLLVDGRTYAGDITVSTSESGLVVVEETSIDRYLYGISEVPFSWPIEALRAQAIAARTYLAWTLERGRSSNGRRFGYDICATDQCQVYRGLDGVAGADGSRWREAVDTTGSQILLDGSEPLQALYSSTTGGRTRSVEDVFGGSPNPHLSAVPSPNEASPFASWRFPIEFDDMALLADEAGHLLGTLLTVRSQTTPDGAGPWTVEFVGTEGTTSVPTWQLRTDLNRAARARLPDVFPAVRPDRTDRRYPQTIMSPSFSITAAIRYESVADGPPRFVPYFEVRGNGWGHLVGMSQYGAEAMARAGASADEIVAHYYGGLQPIRSDQVLPPEVKIGLTTSAEAVTVVPNGPISVEIDGTLVDEAVLGTWSFTFDAGSIVLAPPEGLGLPPDIFDVRVALDRAGRPELVSGRLRSAAELRVTIEERGVQTLVSDWELREAGVFAVLFEPAPEGDEPMQIRMDSRSPDGEDTVVRTVIPVCPPSKGRTCAPNPWGE